jgi:hypothetical protein
LIQIFHICENKTGMFKKCDYFAKIIYIIYFYYLLACRNLVGIDLQWYKNIMALHDALLRRQISRI